MNNIINPIISELIEKGISVRLVKRGYEIEGFYKIGNITLSADPINEGSLILVVKKDKTISISSFADIVKFHNQCWYESRDKKDKKTLANPSKEWLEEYIKLGFVVKQVVYIPKQDL